MDLEEIKKQVISSLPQDVQKNSEKMGNCLLAISLCCEVFENMYGDDLK